MKRYVVTLDERKELSEITTKGSHLSQKVINALILLNCDEGAFNGRSVSLKRGWRRHWVAGKDAVLPICEKPTASSRRVALSCGEPPEGHAQWSLRLLADRVVELGYIDTVSHETVRRVLKKTASSHGSGLGG